MKNRGILGKIKNSSSNLIINKVGWPTWYIKRKWENAYLEGRERLLGNIDIVHSTALTIPQLYNTGLVVTIHDLSFLIFPEYSTKENRDFVLKDWKAENTIHHWNF